MAGGEGKRVGKAVEIGLHQPRVGAAAADVGDEIIPHGAADRAFEIALEGQVHVAWREDDPAIATSGAREADDQPARPVRQRAGTIGPAPDADRRHVGDIDLEIGAGRRGDGHPAGGAAGRHRVADDVLHVRLRDEARQNLGMFVRDGHDPRAGFQDRRRFRRMHQALDRQVDDKVGVAEPGDGVAFAGQGRRGAGGPDDRPGRCRLAGNRHDIKGQPQIAEGGAGKRQIDLPAARFGKNGDALARPRGAQIEDAGEGGLPVRFDPRVRHGPARHRVAGHRLEAPVLGEGVETDNRVGVADTFDLLHRLADVMADIVIVIEPEHREEIIVARGRIYDRSFGKVGEFRRHVVGAADLAFHHDDQITLVHLRWSPRLVLACCGQSKKSIVLAGKVQCRQPPLLARRRQNERQLLEPAETDPRRAAHSLANL